MNGNNLSNIKHFVPQNKEKLCHASGSQKYEIKDCESKRNIYIKRNQIAERKLREELEKYEEVKSMRPRQDKHGRKDNIGIACLATEEKDKT